MAVVRMVSLKSLEDHIYRLKSYNSFKEHHKYHSKYGTAQ